ncbi:SapC family protein [Pseudochelatococcus sp. B33]
MHSIYEPVSFPAHAGVRWSPPTVFEFARDLRFVPVTLLELRRAAHCFPLCLRRIGESVDVVAVLADYEGRNIHLNGLGTWTTEYVPFALRAYPFSLVRNARDQTPRLAVTRDEDVVGPHGRYQLFESSGHLSGPATAVYEELLAAEKSQEAMRLACRSLMHLGVTMQVPPQAIGGRGHRHRLFVVDQDRLQGAWSEQLEACLALYEREPVTMHVAEALVFSQRAFVMRAREPELVEGTTAPRLPGPDGDQTDAVQEDVESYIDYDTNIVF